MADVGWVEDPYVSQQIVPQDTSATGANDPGVFDTGSGINPNSWWGQNLPGWLGGNFAPAAGSTGGGLAGALQSAAGKSGTGSGSGAAGSNPMGMVPNVSGRVIGTPQAAMGQSRSPTSLDSLLQMLMQRRNAYLAATNPQSAKPVDTGIPSGKGLLGL